MSPLARLTAEARALKAQGRLEAALARYREAVAAAPSSAVAEHNLATALGEAGRWREALARIVAAFAKGGDAPESWLVRGRCLQSVRRIEEAERAFEQALRRRPDYADAHTDLAQLRWMRTGDAGEALRALEDAIAAHPQAAELPIRRVRALWYAGCGEAALRACIALLPSRPGDVAALTLASQIAAEQGDAPAAVRFGERALALAPGEVAVKLTLAAALLGMGDARRAEALSAEVVRAVPANQHAIALQATAWRILGDPRYGVVYAYSDLVLVDRIDAPEGWPALDAYLHDLAVELSAAHVLNTHPFDQSIRHGTQVADVFDLEGAAVKALPSALQAPIERALARLGAGDDPVRARNGRGWRYHGAWSIRMRGGGRHIDHVHPDGWLSSAFYVAVPGNLGGREGWLKFGQPGVRTAPALLAEHFVEPSPGTLAIFPSYMWHGTIPFQGEESRLTVAFDLAPGES